MAARSVKECCFDFSARLNLHYRCVQEQSLLRAHYYGRFLEDIRFLCSFLFKFIDELIELLLEVCMSLIEVLIILS